MAVTLGLGTLVLPYSTLFFAHLLSATLVFGAFALLWKGGARPGWVALGGVLVGLAVTVEYGAAFAAPVLGAYAAARPRWPHRMLAYGVGAAVGALPLLLYNLWAFGSFTHLSRTNALVGPPGQEFTPDHGLFGVGVPSFRVAIELLFSKFGLVTLSPVLLAAAAAVVLRYRTRRAEATVIAGIAIVNVAYVSGYYAPWGDIPPTSRYLIPMLPFLALALSLAYRSLPATTAVLALGSGAVMFAFTVTHPLASADGKVLERLGSARFENYSLTVLDLGGVTKAVRDRSLLRSRTLRGALAFVATPVESVDRRDAVGAGLALAVWATVPATGDRILGNQQLGRHAAALAVAALVAAAVLGITSLGRRPRRSSAI